MTLYERFIKSHFTLAPFGIEKGDARSDYFCTPKGARILGWTGVDGIHYCTLKAFGDTVFAVNPYADPKKHAFPVAENFETFLRLLITCGHEAVLEQAHTMTPERFAKYVQENPLTDEQKAYADVLQSTFGLSPLENPYSYLYNIAHTFDYDRIPYKKDYYEFVPVDAPVVRPWRVYSNCSFTGDPEKGERPGKEFPLGCTFRFGDCTVTVPAGYLCSKALVLDVLFEVPSEKVLNYGQKYAHAANETPETRHTNPLCVDFRAGVTVNGTYLPSKRGSSTRYVPKMDGISLPFDTDTAEAVLSHYDLPKDRCYAIHRMSFLWATAKKPVVRSLSLHLESHLVSIPTVTFQGTHTGQTVPFRHPITGAEHTLTVDNIEEGILSENACTLSDCSIPPHYTEITYSVTPTLPEGRCTVRDCRPNDPLRRRQSKTTATISTSDIGIIGGFDAPSVLAFPRRQTGGPSKALSALTFEKQSAITWQIVLREKTVPDVDVQLI